MHALNGQSGPDSREPAAAADLLKVGRSLFDASTSPSLLLSGSGHLLECNRAATFLFEKPSTLVVDAMRRLHYQLLGRWTPMAMLLAEYGATGRQEFTLNSPALGQCILKLEPVEEVPQVESHGQNSRLLLAVFMRPPITDPSVLRVTYGFTEAEARVAALLMKGFMPQQAASEAGVRLSTVRTHIQHIYEKTGTRRQGELLAKLLSRPA
ncbi:helix-turn-helix transcriptional regulator [Piscinibacter koreensis]|uniref:Helix-turn-helix transcriptional regulator n=1 Tax=Piscinibacter koreensis TaxID=2742824 RepID=A0A7Y6TYA3_9BURK|nr:helix-turn-helix transcriptional regulator [Schlegelella koreensis]NUZ07892.1 helix-turn-helix transcriptional regulator [Schlegelella koreensis]